MFPLKDNLPTPPFPLVTLALIAINIGVFGFQLLQPTDQASNRDLAVLGVSERDQLTISYGAIPHRLTHPGSDCGVAASAGEQEVVCDGAPRSSEFPQQGYPENLPSPPWWLTPLTAMFLHAGLLHFAANMLVLWIFGNSLEGRLGRWRLGGLYLLAGIVATYAQALVDLDSTVPSIGSSGAIAGVVGAYALLYPRAKVLWFVLLPLLFTFVEIPAMLLAGAWLGLQFLPIVNQIGSPEMLDAGGVAYLAPIGGLVFGLATARLFASRDREQLHPESAL